MFLYRFINQYNKIIYIGRTNNLIRRLRNEHFTGRGHLPDECYHETVYVEYANVTSQNEATMYELYYIEKHHPKYNQSDIGGGAFSFELQDLVWQSFNFNTDKISKTKQELKQLLDDFTQEIDTECQYAVQLLHNKDRLNYLNKLTDEERNEYLHVIYSLERIVNNISIRSRAIQDDVHEGKPTVH